MSRRYRAKRSGRPIVVVPAQQGEEHAELQTRAAKWTIVAAIAAIVLGLISLGIVVLGVSG